MESHWWCSAAGEPTRAPRTVSFDTDWRFHFGDTSGADAPSFDDGAWRHLDVPHDWMIEGPPGAKPSVMDGPFDPKSPGGAGNGYLDGGVGWYRKHFARPAGAHVAVQFDGVYMNSQVWLNGHSLGVHPYGYTSFEYDLTPYLQDGDNVLAVRTEVIQPCSRFYSGGGIYRHVWLTATDAVHVEHWGSYVTAELKGDTATVTARTQVAGAGASSGVVELDTTVTGPDGTVVGHTVSPIPQTGEVVQTLDVPKPVLWSIQTPALYHLTTVIHVAGREVDRYSTTFGIRTIQFTVDNGFLLNGQHVAIHGVCDHHDLGPLGAAVNTRAIERQLQILKSFGVNAIRTSHYPPAPELLDLCDRMGLVVMDEAFDEWKWGKTPMGYKRFFDDWSERDITSMLHRDRNHPSIVMWSIGNEIPEQTDKRHGRQSAQRLVDICHREDPTRPTTSALSDPLKAIATGFCKPLDVFGDNYRIDEYANPDVHGKVPMIGSETASALSSRGEYGLTLDKAGDVAIKNRVDHQVSDYDVDRPPWGNTAQESLLALQNAPWMAGEFVWTGFDYIGEPTPYTWPSRSSYFGIVDLCGFPKDRTYLYQSRWTDKPMVHLVPSQWNWPQFAGKSIPVWCYTNADSVELLLNGKSLGEKTWAADRVKLHLEWSVPYAPGTLQAVARKDGKIVATDEVKTAGTAARLIASADRTSLQAGTRDLSFITVEAVDSAGLKCPDAGDEVQFTVTGPAKIVGVGNGDATNHESFQGSREKLFHGLALLILQAGDGQGVVTLSASTRDLQPANVRINLGH